MKLVKYIVFIFVLIVSIVFIIKLDKLNMIDNQPVTIKFPYISSFEGYDQGIQVWEAIILTLSVGVLIGFIIALFQIIAQKTELISLKSKIRRLKNELDNLRNQSLDEEISLEDSIDTEETL
jgi:uncharacterized membrane protein YciS (DUF1049 family)